MERGGGLGLVTSSAGTRQTSVCPAGWIASVRVERSWPRGLTAAAPVSGRLLVRCRTLLNETDSLSPHVFLFICCPITLTVNKTYRHYQSLFPVWVLNPFKPEFAIVIFINYKPRIAVAILDLQWMKMILCGLKIK